MQQECVVDRRNYVTANAVFTGGRDNGPAMMRLCRSFSLAKVNWPSPDK
jgi:hypothetical protein